MNNSAIFHKESYLSVITYKIDTEGSQRGYRTSLSKAAGCQPAYLSQVLSGKSHLTVEQAAGLCDYWGFNEDESDYFLTLTEYDRAGSPSLRTKLKKRLTKIYNSHKKSSKNKLSNNNSSFVAPEEAFTYYSSWVHSAAHMYLQIAQKYSFKDLAKRLNIEEDHLQCVLLQLENARVIKKSPNGYEVINKSLHVKNHNTYAPLHHRNWRQKSLDQFEVGIIPDGFHYTGICSLDKKDIKIIREILKKTVVDCEQQIISSKEKTIACLSIDWFEI